MKHFLSFLFSFVIILTVKAQNSFEGTVRYAMKTIEIDYDKETTDTSDVLLTVHFGKNAFKILSNRKNQEAIIIRLDSGKIFVLNGRNKSFRSRELITSQDPELTNKTIAGQQTKAIDGLKGMGTGLWAAMFSRGSLTMYVSDNLYYNIPEKYSIANVELIVIRNNHIVLGADALMKGSLFDPDEREETRITINAIDITPANIDEKEFMIPEGYRNTRDQSSEDSVMVMTDSTASIPPPPPPPKKPVPSKSKPRGTSTKPVKKDMRKPD